jgi:hypothetical protein
MILADAGIAPPLPNSAVPQVPLNQPYLERVCGYIDPTIINLSPSLLPCHYSMAASQRHLHLPPKQHSPGWAVSLLLLHLQRSIVVIADARTQPLGLIEGEGKEESCTRQNPSRKYMQRRSLEIPPMPNHH